LKPRKRKGPIQKKADAAKGKKSKKRKTPNGRKKCSLKNTKRAVGTVKIKPMGGKKRGGGKPDS